MATELPPLPPISPSGPRLFGFNEPPLQPDFLDVPRPTDTPYDTPIAGQNHDRSIEPVLEPIPPQPSTNITMPPTSDAENPPPATAPIATDSDQPNNEQPSSDRERGSESGDGSGSDHGESEDEDEQQDPHNQWQPIEEDKSVPCEDELAYIAQRGEHSALDYAYWERKIFFDLDDPEIYPVGSGRLDWLVEHFNGTKENPNKECVMRSQTLHVAGYDWRIKLYPKGNNSDYLSVYLECVTMQADDFEESQDRTNPPLPFLSGRDQLKQRASVAVQLGVVMYNPAEPRVYESQIDAHQFTKKSSDYGWTRFTRHSRREFSFRMHGQRQAILRDDQLAFSAYIRIVHDPTQCMWAHGSDRYNDSLTLTGLRPFSTLTPMYSAKLPLLHFAPFREFICKSKDVKIVYWLQCLLWKMMSRTRSANYGNPIHSLQCDAIAWLRHIAIELRRDTDPIAINELIGSFDPDHGAAVGANRLKTKAHNSVQAAVDAHPTPIATPALLTLELEREEFDRKERSWAKLTNKVEMQNRIIVAGQPYLLYAFATHCGDLTSNRFNVYIRPSGPNTPHGLWYAYSSGDVTAMTHKQAVDAHSGFDLPGASSPLKESSSSRHHHSAGGGSSRGHRRPFRFDDLNEVAHVVYYVRDDCRHFLVEPRVTETWEASESVRFCKPSKETYDRAEQVPQTAIGPGEMSAEMERELAAQIERERQSSFDELSGAATPSAWMMDGEDIVMSDAEADGETAVVEQEEEKKSELLQLGCVIEHLGREYYKGSLLGNRYHGEGHLIYMNGDEYVGSFVAGEKCGHGKMLYARTGNIYEGDWFQDQHHGQGTLTEAKTQNVFEGGWKNGKKSGQFVLKGTVTDDDKGCCSICYDKEINTAFYDCGHVLACRECAYKIDQCPVCRRRVVGRLELFGVKMIFE